jgi:LCP family protein required for cell wall assembly
MRIGIDIRNIGKQRTGDEVVFLNLVKNLALLDNENEYFLFTNITDTSIIPIMEVTLGIKDKKNFKIVSLKSRNKFCWNIRVLPKYLRKNPVDIYHTQYITPFFVSRKIKIITHIHDVSFKAYPKFIKKSDLFFLNWLIPKSLKRADKIVAVSEFTKSEIVKYYKIDPEKIEVIYNALEDNFKEEISEEKLLEVRKKYNLPEKFILYLGTLQPRKNVASLIGAFAQIKDKIPDFKLVLAGNRNAHNFDQKIDEIIAKENIQNRVIFPGYVDWEDKIYLFHLATVFAHPSLYEGFGIPLLEAMSQEVPVIASEIPVFKEIAQDSVLFFNPSSLDDLKEKLYTICIDENLRNKFRSLGKERLEFFSWKKSAENLENLYKNIFQLKNNSKNMNYSYSSNASKGSGNNKPKKKRKWLKIVLISVGVLLITGGLVAWKASSVLNKVSVNSGLFNSLVHSIPGVSDELKGEKEDRINVLLLGMRGENVTGGGLLADTIMIASIEPKANKVSLVSVPRDLYVTDPGKDSKSKINAVYAYGEERKKNGGGIEDMETIAGEITGLPINYSVVINFEGFKKLVDALGGIDITLSKPFEESAQFNEPHICNSFFTQPTGKYETKTVKYYSNTDKVWKTRVTASYPLCTAPADTLECGGDFKLPAGKNTLNGAKTLCFVRSRDLTSDFERAKRQQIVLQQIKEKASQLGIMDFAKINAILDDLGENVRTDMQAWEMKRLFDLYKGMNAPQIYQRVLEDSEEGLLYAPQQTPETGYILLPRGDSYDQIKNLFQNIFTMPAQSDIKPQI